MPAKAGTSTPSYRLHRASGRAMVTLVDRVTGRRRTLYLGRYDSPKSRERYHDALKRWEASDRRLIDLQHRGPVTVRDVADAYRARLEDIASPTVQHTSGVVLDLLVEHHGELPAKKFGPRLLKQLRPAMAKRGWCRSSINSKRVRAIVRAFQWAASEEMIPEAVWRALLTVEPLKEGELETPESKPVKPVPMAHVDAVRPHLPPQVCAMIDVQLYTGARPGEVCAMRLMDIEATGKVWTYRPATHKNAWRGKDRQVFLGPRAQAAIQPFMSGRAMDAPLFSPREAYAARRAQQAQGGGRRDDQPETPRKTARVMGDAYDANSYRKAIEYACRAAKVPTWTPNRLRHTAATLIRKEHGLEAAALILGHASATITDAVYAERDTTKARDVIAKVG